MYLKERIACIVLVAVAVLSAPIAIAQGFGFNPVAKLIGDPRVKDGDGLLFGEVEIRLQGIAAPEMGDPMGRISADNLRGIVEGKRATCYLDGTRAGKSKRPVGVCTVDGKDVGELQVRAGMALDCPRFSLGRYRDAESMAVLSGHDLSESYALPNYCK